MLPAVNDFYKDFSKKMINIPEDCQFLSNKQTKSKV